MLGIIVTLACSLAFTLFDASRKQLMSKWQVLPLLVVLMLGQAVVVFAIWAGAFFVEQGEVTFPLVAGGYWRLLAISIGTNTVANGLFLTAVRLAPFSMVIPMLSLTPLFAAVGEWFWLGQQLTTMQIIGIAGIMVATFGLGWCAFKTTTVVKNVLNDTQQPLLGMVCMVGVAVLWALAPVADKAALAILPNNLAGMLLHGWLLYVGIGVGALAAVLLVKQPLLPKSDKLEMKWLVLALLAAAASTMLQLWAITLMPVGIFEGLKRAFGLLGALVFGKLLFAEKITPTQCAWVGVLLLAVLLIT